LIQVWAVGSPSRTDRKGKNDITDGEFQTYTNGLWRFNGRKDPGYPATFPPELPERLIKLFTWPEELVVDCFCGSGTTLCAAKRLGRQWWGCDVNNKAVKLARRRIAEIDCLFPAPLTSE
jgi:site-specific DNA-methyltransferase (adenine-specific)